MAYRKWNYETVKSFIENDSLSGCKLISPEYKKMKQKIQIACACGNIFSTTFDKFVYQNKRCCDDCTRYKMRINLAKTHETFCKEINNIYGNEYIIIGTYINALTPIKILHNKENCMHQWDIRPNDILRGEKCPKCQHRSYKKTTDEFKQEVYNLCENEFSILSEYVNSHELIKIQHNICGYIWDTKPSSFLNGSQMCPKCYGNIKRTQEEFNNLVYNLVKNEYEVLGEYVNCNTKIKILHKKCGHYLNITPTNFLSGQRCSYCEKSKGENIIKSFLEFNNIKYDQNYSFEDCKYKRLLKYDFVIFNSDNSICLLIEYDGAQHYYNVKKFGGIEEYYNRLKRDQIKNEYCEQNRIDLLRIPYWDFKNIEKILIDAFIKRGIQVVK